MAGALDYDTIAKQAEDSGYLPAQNYQNRKLLLSIPDGAIRYINGIMAAIADSAGRYGFRDIRSDPEILTNVDQSMDLRKWQEHPARSRKVRTFPAAMRWTYG